jgi:phenylalanyl-tRNA synthetase beta chain
LGFEITDHGQKMNVIVPTRRLDVHSAEDLIEEVGRVYGYDAIASVAPVLPIFSASSWVQEDEDVAWDEHAFIRERGAIGRALSGAGYSEVYNYVFLSDELKNLFSQSSTLYELALPQSAEYRWLRTSLVPRMLINARDNLRFLDEVRIFETGHVFDRIGKGKESARLGLLLARRGGDATLFYELKGAIDVLCEHLGIDDVSYDDAEPLAFAQRALIRDEDGKELGFIGVVHGRVADALKLKGSAVVAELDLRALIEHAQEEREFEPLPKYPSVIRDIAVMVPVDTKIDDILQTIEDADQSGLVQDVDVFDIFEPTGKEKLKAEGDTPEYGKSVAFHIIYRSADHTLTDKEVSAAEAVIKRALEENLSAQIR